MDTPPPLPTVLYQLATGHYVSHATWPASSGAPICSGPGPSVMTTREGHSHARALPQARASGS